MSDSSANPWIIACQAPLAMGLPRQEYQSGLPLPPAGDLPNPGTEPCLLQWQVSSLPLYHLGSPASTLYCLLIYFLFSMFLITKQQWA